jgi:hypothetical protein
MFDRTFERCEFHGGRSDGAKPARRVLGLLFVCAITGMPNLGCVTEPATDESIVQLPPGSEEFERFINAPGQFTADRITIQALTAYRKDVAPVTSPESHLRSVTPDRIELTNKTPEVPGDPVRLSFRQLHLAARESLTVIFSDVPLQHPERDPILLIVGNGVAKLVSPTETLLADRVVIRNGEAQAFRSDGQPTAGK